MIDIDTEIECRDFEDLKLIVEILKSEHTTTPVYIMQSKTCFYARFNTDYNDNQLEYRLRPYIEGFEFKERLDIGQSDVRMKIRRTQDNSTDSWGRPLDPFDTTLYLVPVKTSEPEQISPHFRASFGDEIRDYKINISKGFRPGSEEKGFIVLGDQVEGKEAPVIINHLFQTVNEAFWAGLNKKAETIQEEYEAYKRKKNRKPRVKKNKEQK